MASDKIIYQDCPKCKGGTKQILATVTTGPENQTALVPITCDVCDGSGVIKFGHLEP